METTPYIMTDADIHAVNGLGHILENEAHAVYDGGEWIVWWEPHYFRCRLIGRSDTLAAAVRAMVESYSTIRPTKETGE